MARPKTKTELLDSAVSQYAALEKLIDSWSELQQKENFHFKEAFLAKKKEAHWRRDQNLRDVLIHLYEWQKLLLHFVDQNEQGVATRFLPAPYNWRNYGQMNEAFVQKHQQTSLAEAKALLSDSHQQTLALIEKYSEKQLFEKQFFSWTGSTHLGSYCISATGSHYEWAIKKLRARQKQRV